MKSSFIINLEPSVEQSSTIIISFSNSLKLRTRFTIIFNVFSSLKHGMITDNFIKFLYLILSK